MHSCWRPAVRVLQTKRTRVVDHIGGHNEEAISELLVQHHVDGMLPNIHRVVI